MLFNSYVFVFAFLPLTLALFVLALRHIGLMAELGLGKALVTGAAGSVGGVLVRRLLRLGLERVRAFDNNESELFFSARRRCRG